MESTIYLLKDVVDSFFQMEKSIQDFIGKLVPNELEERMNEIREAFDQMCELAHYPGTLFQINLA